MEGPAPYLLVQFTNHVTLTHLEARGSVFGTVYVTGFRLEVQQESGDFTAYGVTDEPTVRLVYIVSLYNYIQWNL